MMIIKKILLFAIMFIVACAILIAINPTKSDYVESEVYLIGEYKINADENIKLVLDPRNLTLNWRASADLIDTVRLYRAGFYPNDKIEPKVVVDGNNIVLSDIVSPIDYYVSRTFGTIAQLDSNYYINKICFGYRLEYPKDVNVDYIEYISTD